MFVSFIVVLEVDECLCERLCKAFNPRIFNRHSYFRYRFLQKLYDLRFGYLLSIGVGVCDDRLGSSVQRARAARSASRDGDVITLVASCVQYLQRASVVAQCGDCIFPVSVSIIPSVVLWHAVRSIGFRRIGLVSASSMSGVSFSVALVKVAHMISLSLFFLISC